MQFKVAVEGNSAKDVHAKLLFAAAQFAGEEAVDAIDVSTLRSGKSGKQAAAAEEAEEFDLGETAEDAEPAPKKLTLEKVIKAFGTYAEENSREDAIKILKKLGAKSVKTLDPKDFAKAMKLLGA